MIFYDIQNIWTNEQIFEQMNKYLNKWTNILTNILISRVDIQFISTNEQMNKWTNEQIFLSIKYVIHFLNLSAEYIFQF